MSQRMYVNKKIRKATRNSVEKHIKEIGSRPFRVRLKWAWRIIWGK